jgi:hypothetical protein
MPASTTPRFLGLRVRKSPAAWMSVCCEFCVYYQVYISLRRADHSSGGSPSECGVVWVRSSNFTEEVWAHYGCRAMKIKRCSPIMQYFL